jgi:ubiquinone/menaquinone biosynthesis C-methylase UbiE
VLIVEKPRDGNILIASDIVVDENAAMTTENRQAHWQKVYISKGENEVSWFQENPAPSVDLIAKAGATTASAVIDVGGGASRLVDALLESGFRRVTVLDLSEAALAAAKARLGGRADEVQWVVADVTEWEPQTAAYDLWHDRATFHFLTEECDRAAYVARLTKAVKPGGRAIIATFAPEGPERCSGLPVVRYDAQSLRRAIGDGFKVSETLRHEHRTPWGAAQNFQFSVFRRAG